MQNQQLNAIFNSYQKRFCKLLNFEMFSDHVPFHSFGIDADLIYKITINEINKLLNATEMRNWNFGLKNIMFGV